jgi:hypothetical protein
MNPRTGPGLALIAAASAARSVLIAQPRRRIGAEPSQRHRGWLRRHNAAYRAVGRVGSSYDIDGGQQLISGE